jgi:hypothetical protein
MKWRLNSEKVIMTAFTIKENLDALNVWEVKYAFTKN